jgi:hypothetical protein
MIPKTRPIRLGRRKPQREAQLLRIIELQERQMQLFLEALLEFRVEWSDPLSQLANEAMKKRQ